MPRRACSISLAHLGVRLAPAVRHVGHEQQAQPVGPVQLARHVDLDVQPVGVQPDPARPQDLVPHEGVAREGVEALRMIRLVERHLQIDRLVVQRDVGEVRAGQLHHADLPHAEVGRDAVLAVARAGARPRPRTGTDPPATRAARWGWGRRTAPPWRPCATACAASGRPPVLKSQLELGVRPEPARSARPVTVTLPWSMSGEKCTVVEVTSAAGLRDRPSARCRGRCRSPACLRA